MISDITSKALIQIGIDESDLIDGLKKIEAQEKRMAKAQDEHAEARNKGFDVWVERLGHLNQALELGGKVAGFAADSYKAYADHLRLAAAAGTANIERLRAASLGLRTEHELLTFAAQTQHGVFKLTQEQMETAQKAMVALTRAGFDQEEVTKKVTDALIKGKAEGLDDFGISIDSTKTKVGDFNALMGALAEKASGVDTGMRTASESMQASGISIHDSFDKMKQALGALVVAMAPLLEALSAAVELIADIAIASVKDVNWIDAANKWAGKEIITRDKGAAEILALGQRAIGAPEKRRPINAYDRWNNDELGGFDEGSYATFMRKHGLMGDQGKTESVGSSNYFGDIRSSIRAGMFDAIGMLNTGTGKLTGKMGEIADAGAFRERNPYDEHADFNRNLAEWKKGVEELQKKLDDQFSVAGRLKDMFGIRGPGDTAESHATFLESTFGKLEDFNAYATAFSMLTGSVTAGMDAWISGSMSAGQAIKKFIGEALKGLASQLAVEALKHGAYALGSLAFGDFAGASAHGIAAGAFGAAAAAAAVAAKAMGHGGADYGKAASTGGGASGGRANGGSVNSPGSGEHNGSNGPVREIHTFTYLDPFAGWNETQRKQYAQQMVNKAVEQSSARR